MIDESWCGFGKNLVYKMVALAPDEIFENMLQLKHFRLYSERILYIKWLQLLATEMLAKFGA